MALLSLTSFSAFNRRQLLQLLAGHLLWCGAVFGLWASGPLFETSGLWWSGGFMALQLYAAAQLLLPALLLQPEKRSRFFYLFWASSLALAVWLLHQPSPGPNWQPLLTILRSGLLLGVATLVGAALGRYVRRVWEIIPICLVMALADVASFFGGPTAGFSQAIKKHYLAPDGPAPLIDMFLVKLAFPGPAGLAPVFGISDWIMAVFFTVVARRYGINDNLLGPPGEELARRGLVGGYLPVSVVALLAAMVLAQTTGLFIPALPLMALAVLPWYAAHFLRRHQSTKHRS